MSYRIKNIPIWSPLASIGPMLVQGLVQGKAKCGIWPKAPIPLGADNRGGITILLAFLMVGLMIAVGLGVEASGWAASKVSMQRTADVAANAGALVYVQTGSPQKAAAAAGQVAQLNGVAPNTALTWNAAAQTLSGGQLTVQVQRGIQNASDTALQVTVGQVRPTVFTGLVGSMTQVTIPAVATAEAVFGYTPASGTWTPGPGGSGGQPCLLALATTGTNISLTGSAQIAAPNCTVRSDASISLLGTTTIAANATYASGSVSIATSSQVTGSKYTSAGVSADPYAAYSPVQTALAQLSAGSGAAVSLSGVATQTLSPGTYLSWTVGNSAVLTLTPGLYVVNGNVHVSGNAHLTGSGVTIVMSGTFSNTGSGVVNITAPDTSPTNNAVSGVVLAGTTSGSVTFSGGVSPTMVGVVYVPNAAVTWSGSASSAPSCLELIVSSITITGGASLSGDCSSLGALPFGSWPSSLKGSLIN
jgi:Flp pilus assembly protein TadG